MKEQNTQNPNLDPVETPVSQVPSTPSVPASPAESEGIDTKFKVIAGVLAAAVLALGIFFIKSGGDKQADSEKADQAQEATEPAVAPSVTEGQPEISANEEQTAPEKPTTEADTSITSQKAVNIDYEISQLDNQLGDPDEDDFKEDQLSESNVGL